MLEATIARQASPTAQEYTVEETAQIVKVQALVRDWLARRIKEKKLKIQQLKESNPGIFDKIQAEVKAHSSTNRFLADPVSHDATIAADPLGTLSFAIQDSIAVREKEISSRLAEISLTKHFDLTKEDAAKIFAAPTSTLTRKDLLEKIGLEIIELYLYDVCAFRDTTQWNEFRTLFSQNSVDGIIFTSASSVRAFFEIMEKDFEHSKLLEHLHILKVVAIGPFTADELKKFDVQNIIANVHTVAGSVDLIANELSLA